MSRDMIKVKPAEGLIVRDPATREALPVKGKSVPRNAYWLRRLKDGDVIEESAAPATPAATPESEKKPKAEKKESR